jgi:hypothetical protein
MHQLQKNPDLDAHKRKNKHQSTTVLDPSAAHAIFLTVFASMHESGIVAEP